MPTGQLIYLQRKRKTGANEFHLVSEGESTYDICQMEAIRLETMLEYNHLANGMQPAVGEKLYLRTMAPSRPELLSAKRSVPAPLSTGNINQHPDDTVLTHVVKTKKAFMLFHGSTMFPLRN